MENQWHFTEAKDSPAYPVFIRSVFLFFGDALLALTM